jgi:hypothetical protein
MLLVNSAKDKSICRKPRETSNKSVRNFSRPGKMSVANQDNQTKEIFFLVDY